MEKIPSFIKVNTFKNFQSFFFNFVFDILNKDINDKYNEGLVKKFVVLAENIIKEKEFEQVISVEILEQFLEKLKNIIMLKFDNDYQNLCFNIWKNNNPIWLFAAEELMKVTPILIEGFKMNQMLADIFKTILTTKKEKKSILLEKNNINSNLY